MEASRRWAGEADVYMIYGKEAFPSEAAYPAPVPDGEPVLNPTTSAQRSALATRFTTSIGDEVPILLDDLADSLMSAYDAYPFRVYAIDTEGRIAVPSSKGAAGFELTLERIDSWLNRQP